MRKTREYRIKMRHLTEQLHYAQSNVRLNRMFLKWSLDRAIEVAAEMRGLQNQKQPEKKWI